MKILFISQYYPDDIIERCARISKIGLDWAAHNLSKAIIQGFKDNYCDISILNIPLMGSFPPFSKSPIVPSAKGDKMESIGYVNATYLKRIDAKRRTLHSAKKWCAETHGQKTIIFYNFKYIDIITELKNKYSDIKIVLLVTDLPEYTTPHETIFTRINNIISPLENEKKGNHYELIDGYILLAKGMKERLPIGDKPWMLMEGIYNNESKPICKCTKENRYKNIMYTGNLGKRYGIKLLLDAFSIIKDSNYRLWIRGNGELEEEIKTLSQKDDRITYLERMSREELVEKQQKATLMINTTLPSAEFANYFFPSKTLEYMASGTPTLMFKLPCMPQEYYDYLYFIEEETSQHLADKIIELCCKSVEELDAFGAKAAGFIFENKTPKPQIARVVSFIQNL